MKRLLLVAIVCFSVALASTVQRTVLEATAKPTQEWLVEERVPTDHKVHLIFALKQQNLDQLEKIFWEVSDPKSPHYGKFKTMEEINKIIAPKTETVAAVRAFLNQHPVSSIQHYADYIEVDCTASVAEAMLGAPYVSPSLA